MDTIKAMSEYLKVSSSVVALLVPTIVAILSFPVQTCQAFDLYTEDPIMVFEQHITFLYETIGLKKRGMDFEVFRYALIGYFNLKRKDSIKKRGIISIIDYRKSSNDKRFYVIDIIRKKVLYHTLVAHGRHSGDIYASYFSNEPGSLQSSLGFFVTGDTYDGEHGYSLSENTAGSAAARGALPCQQAHISISLIPSWEAPVFFSFTTIART
jgi:hypothetical protein